MTSASLEPSRPIAELTEKHLRTRVPLYHPDFPFVILWSQKAACTPVARWFFYQIGVQQDDLMQGVRVHLFEKTYKSRPNYYEEMVDVLRTGKKPIIKFVRDPYARAFSSYLELSSRAARNPSYWGEKARRAIIRDLTGFDAAPEYTFTFLQYLRWLVHQDMNSLNAHIRPQHLSRDGFFSLRLVRIEDLKQNFAGLEREFGLPKRAEDEPRLLESEHFHKKIPNLEPGSALKLLELGIPLMKSPEFGHVRFDARLAKGTQYERLVRRCFPRDVALYGY